jgi:hypothetical protein
MTDRTALRPDRVTKFTTATADAWMVYSGMALVDVADEDDSPAMLPANRAAKAELLGEAAR